MSAVQGAVIVSFRPLVSIVTGKRTKKTVEKLLTGCATSYSVVINVYKKVEVIPAEKRGTCAFFLFTQAFELGGRFFARCAFLVASRANLMRYKK